MDFRKTVFVKSAAKASDFPRDRIPRVVFVGRSNVGKSSTINAVVGKKGFARVSSVPGKTVFVNLFKVDEKGWLIDLPGYGYAKVAKGEKRRWAEMMEGYFAASQNLKLLIILLDIRHDPSSDDVDMINWALEYNVPFLCVLTKADKIAKSKRYNCIAHMKKVIKADEDYPMIAVSSKEKIGRDSLLEIMEKFLG